MTVNKAKLIERMAEATGISKSTATVAFNNIFDNITKELAAGNSVSISSFGKYEVRKRAARRGVSPRKPTQSIQIPEVRVARFRTGKSLKLAVKK